MHFSFKRKTKSDKINCEVATSGSGVRSQTGEDQDGIHRRHSVMSEMSVQCGSSADPVRIQCGSSADSVRIQCGFSDNLYWELLLRVTPEEALLLGTTRSLRLGSLKR